VISSFGAFASSGGVIAFRCGGESASQAPDDLARCNDLAGVALGMLGRVEQQSQDITRELGTAYHPGRKKLPFRHLLQDAHGIVDGNVDHRKQFLRRRGRRARVSFSTQGDQLLIPDGAPLRVGEEPVQAACNVSKMKSYGSSTTRPCPQFKRREGSRSFTQIMTRLQQSVSDGYQDRQDTLDRATQPELGSGGGHVPRAARGWAALGARPSPASAVR
jgi:hypothetical protein